MTPISTEQTLGYSPKVVWPGLAIAGFGAGLIALGAAAGSRGLRYAGGAARVLAARRPPRIHGAPRRGRAARPYVRDSHEHESARHVTRYVRRGRRRRDADPVGDLAGAPRWHA